MNNRVFATFGLIAALFLFTPTLYAAATSGPDYEVEVLVFKNDMPELEGKEIWSPERVDMTLPEIDSASKAADTSSEETDLGKAALAMSEKPGYVILAHKRWSQTADAKSTSPLMRISTDSGDLDGTLVFYLSRFLHVEVKMLLKDMNGSDGAGSAAGKSDPANDGKTTAENQLMAYRITESRRVRSNEINYFDHPKFGVLVQITPRESSGKN